MACFGLDLSKPIFSIDKEKLNYSNILKKFAYQVFKRSINTDGDDEFLGDKASARS